MIEQLWWHVARSGGIVALLMAGISVLTGLVFAAKAVRGHPSPKWQLDMHRFLGGSTVVFTIVHVAALIADNFVHFGLTEVLVPLASAWNPVAVAWGILAMYLLVAVEVSSLLMRKMPRKWWRLIHMGSFGVLWTGLVHGATAGTDASSPVYVAVMACMILATMALVVYRVLSSRTMRKAMAT